MGLITLKTDLSSDIRKEIDSKEKYINKVMIQLKQYYNLKRS